MLTLLDAVHAQPLPEPTGDYDSLVEYDRRRVLKEQLLYTTIAACLDMTLAVGVHQGAVGADHDVDIEDERFVPHGRRTRFASNRPFSTANRTRPARRLPSFLEQFQQESLAVRPR